MFIMLISNDQATANILVFGGSTLYFYCAPELCGTISDFVRVVHPGKRAMFKLIGHPYIVVPSVQQH